MSLAQFDKLIPRSKPPTCWRCYDEPCPKRHRKSDRRPFYACSHEHEQNAMVFFWDDLVGIDERNHNCECDLPRRWTPYMNGRGGGFFECALKQCMAHEKTVGAPPWFPGLEYPGPPLLPRIGKDDPVLAKVTVPAPRARDGQGSGASTCTSSTCTSPAPSLPCFKRKPLRPQRQVRPRPSPMANYSRNPVPLYTPSSSQARHPGQAPSPKPRAQDSTRSSAGGAVLGGRVERSGRSPPAASPVSSLLPPATLSQRMETMTFNPASIAPNGDGSGGGGSPSNTGTDMGSPSPLGGAARESIQDPIVAD